MYTQSSTQQRATPPPHPSPSPTWAEAARGGSSTGEYGDHTRVGPPFPPPCAHSQYGMVHCRRGGLPAKRVLETDGITEEFSLWFRTTAAGDATTQAHAHHSGKRRREQARRARRRVERRREAPPAMPTTGMAATMATVPLPPPPELLPSTAISITHAHVYKARPLALKKTKVAMTASRSSQRAAVLAKKRGTSATRLSSSTPSDEPTPEKLCGEETDLNITLGLSLPPPSPPSLNSSPAPASPTLPRPPSPSPSPPSPSPPSPSPPSPSPPSPSPALNIAETGSNT